MVGAWPRGMRILGLALVYVALAKIPLSSNLAFQAYLFWPAAALASSASSVARAWRMSEFGMPARRAT